MNIIRLSNERDDHGLYIEGREFAFPKYPKGQSRNTGTPLYGSLYARGPLAFIQGEAARLEKQQRERDEAFQRAVERGRA